MEIYVNTAQIMKTINKPILALPYSIKELRLKGQLHEIFDPRFFSSNNPLYRTLILGLQPFRMASYSPRNSNIIDFSGVIDTTEIAVMAK
jgi:hypothetical protein